MRARDYIPHCRAAERAKVAGSIKGVGSRVRVYAHVCVCIRVCLDERADKHAREPTVHVGGPRKNGVCGYAREREESVFVSR